MKYGELSKRIEKDKARIAKDRAALVDKEQTMVAAQTVLTEAAAYEAAEKKFLRYAETALAGCPTYLNGVKKALETAGKAIDGKLTSIDPAYRPHSTNAGSGKKGKGKKGRGGKKESKGGKKYVSQEVTEKNAAGLFRAGVPYSHMTSLLDASYPTIVKYARAGGIKKKTKQPDEVNVGKVAKALGIGVRQAENILVKKKILDLSEE